MNRSPPPSSTAAIEARYGAVSAVAAPNAMVAQMLEHRSVRAYAAEPVGDEILSWAVAAAQSASTSSNLQPWSVIVVRDRARLARLARQAGGQRHVAEAPLFLAWVVDWSRLRRMGELYRTPTDGIDYLESYTLGVVDVALAAQNAAVALESIGLGLVYIGGMRNQPEAVAAELDLPPGSFVLFGMCVGWPDPARATAVKPRLPQAVVLHRERYDSSQEIIAIRDYDRRMSDFQRNQHREDGSWSRIAVERVRRREALGGRHRLRSALKALGLALR